MRTTNLLRAVFAFLLLCSISSFSGCDKSDDASPRACTPTTTAPADSTSAT